MSRCNQCGYDNRPGNNFCVNCGSVMQISKEYLQKEKDKQNNVVLWVVLIVILYFVSYCSLTTITQHNAEKDYERISRDAEQQTKRLMRDAEAETDRLMRKYSNP